MIGDFPIDFYRLYYDHLSNDELDILPNNKQHENSINKWPLQDTNNTGTNRI